MRLPEYLSPTSLKLFYDDIEAFYCRYLSENRPEREPQTQPMAIGSGFDAFVKSYLYTQLFGKGTNARYELNALFEEQVTNHRDWAWQESESLFNIYRDNGCLADLMLDLGAAVGPPRFEFDVRGEIEGVPLLGKPDVFFISKKGARVILDWKVNGYCGKSLKSPMKGYLKLRDSGKISCHKDCLIINKNGIDINISMFLEDGNDSWADQLSIYGWLLGEAIGSEELIVGIDQVCGPACRLRFATHRLRVSPDYQFALVNNLVNAWDTIISGWIFRDMTEENSKKRAEVLDNSEITDSAFDSLTKETPRFFG